jgi:hypothetical protein
MPMTKRLFIAIDLPDDVRRRLARLVAAAPPGVRPTRPGQMHLTLHFLGDVAEEAIRGVPVERFTVYSTVAADRGTEHVVEAGYPLAGPVTPPPTAAP